jgi:hypothetical protein
MDILRNYTFWWIYWYWFCILNVYIFRINLIKLKICYFWLKLRRLTFWDGVSSFQTCGKPYFMGKVLCLVCRQCLERNNGNYLVCYHKWLQKTHNNCLDYGQKFDKEMKYTAIIENSWTDRWLDTLEYN